MTDDRLKVSRGEPEKREKREGTIYIGTGKPRREVARGSHILSPPEWKREFSYSRNVDALRLLFHPPLSFRSSLLRSSCRRLDRKDSAAKKNARSPLVAHSRFVPVLYSSLSLSPFCAFVNTHARGLWMLASDSRLYRNSSLSESLQKEREREIESKGSR